MELFDVRKDETRTVGLSLLLSFAIGIPRVFTLAAANDLFMAAHGPAKLPWAYTVGAIILALIGLLYVRLGRHLSPQRLGMLVLASLAAFDGLAYLGLDLFGPRIVSFALILAVEAEFTLSSLVFWAVMSRLFDISQARRLFGLVSAGEVVPTVAGGLALPWLVQAIGVQDLLLVSVAGHSAAILALRNVERAAQVRSVPEEAAPNRSAGAAQLAQRRYLRWVAAIVALNVFVYYAVDNAFYHATQEANLGPGELAAFLGNFFVALGLVNFVFRIFLSGRWRGWLGLKAALASVPLSLGVLAGVALLSQGPLHTASGALLAVVLLKLWERVSVEAIHVPSLHTLLLPLPAKSREAARGTLDGVVAHGATLVGGGVLVLLNQQLELGVAGLSLVALGSLALWGVIALKAASAYGRVLEAALAERRMDTEGLRSADASTLRMLEAGLSSPDASRVLWHLHLLRELEHPRLEALCLRLLEHADPVVVEAAARLLEREGSATAASALAARLEAAEDLPARARARILRALAKTAPDHALTALRHHLGDATPEAVAAAAVGLFRHGDPSAAKMAAPRLTVLSRAPEAKSRRIAARAMGSIGTSAMVRPLTRLLRDDDVEVQRAALRAAARISDARVWPFVVDAISQRRLRDSAAEALVRGGPSALPHVIEAAERPGQYWRIQHQLVEIAARIGGDGAAQFILRTIVERGAEDLDLRHAALRALDGAQMTLGPDALPHLEGCISVELEVLAALAEAASPLPGWEPGDLLAAALEDQQRGARDRLLLLLGAVLDDPALREARTFAASPSREDRGLAAELVEQRLPRRWAERVLPSLDPSSSAAREPSPEARAAVLATLPARARGWGMRWLLTCAVDAAAAAGVRPEGFDLGESEASLDRVRALSRCDLLAGLGGQQLGDLAVRAKVRALDPGAPLTVEGQLSRSYHILQDGLLSHATTGKRPGLMAPGYSTEALALLRPVPAAATLTAESSATVLEVDHESLQDLLDDDLDAAWAVLRALCGRMRQGLVPRPAVEGARPAAPHSSDEADRTYYATLQRLLTLRATPTFEGVEESVLLALAEAVSEEAFAAGERIVSEGELGTSMYILVSGKVRVHTEDQTIAEIPAPDVFGELSAIDPAPRSASVTASEPTRALVLARGTLRGLALAQHDILRVMMDLVLDRMKIGSGGRQRAAARPTFVTDDMTL